MVKDRDWGEKVRESLRQKLERERELGEKVRERVRRKLER